MFFWADTTAFLLVALLLATITADLFLGRRAWCKYLCPLGRIVSLVSRISFLQMRSNPNVCSGRCRVDDCIKEKECPMGLHPTGINTSDHCLLCFSCVRHCPHHSMHLDLRSPAEGILSRPRRRFSEALFAVALTGTLLAVKGAPRLLGAPPTAFPAEVWSGEELALALALLSGYIALALAGSVGSSGRRWIATFTLIGQAYLPLAFTALFLVYFRALVEGGDRILPLLIGTLGLGNLLDPALFTPELGTLRLLIPVLLCAGGAFSSVLLGRLARHYTLNRYSLTAHRFLLLLSGGAFLALL